TTSSTRQNPNNRRALTQTRSSLTPEKPVISRYRATTRKNDQDITPHVLPKLDDISVVSLSIWRQRRTKDQIFGSCHHVN
ncbi:unnamed protein product, partial [Hymenolepis diminuta]